MLRAILYSVAVLLLLPLLGAAVATYDKVDDNKKADRPQRAFGTVVNVDAAKHTITLKVRGKDGKEHEKTIELKEGVKLIGEDGKEDKEAHFLKELRAGEVILVMEREGKIVEIRDLPARPRVTFGTVVKVDAAQHSLTFKARSTDGKEAEKTVEIKGGIKLVGEDGKEDKEAHFLKELKSGEQIAIVEREGKIVEVRDLPDRPRFPSAGTVVKVDAANRTMTVKLRGRDGKEQEKGLELKEGVKLLGTDGKEAKLADFAAGDAVVFVEREGKLVFVRELGPFPRMTFGTVVKVEADRHSITFKLRGKDGKEEEKTIELKEGVKLLGEDGKEDKEANFLKELKAGEQILVTVREGKVVEIRDLPERKKRGDRKND